MIERLEKPATTPAPSNPPQIESLNNLDCRPPNLGRLNNKSLLPTDFMAFFKDQYGFEGSSFLRQVVDRIACKDYAGLKHVEIKELAENLRKFYVKNSPLSNILTQTRQNMWRKLLKQLVSPCGNRDQIVNRFIIIFIIWVKIIF